MSSSNRFDEFGTDGGPAAKELSPKLAVVQRFLTSKLGEGVPKIDVTYFVAASMVLKGLGGALFVFGSSLGAYLLCIAYFGALLYFLGMKNSITKKQLKKKTQKTKTS
ncbi:hypothetical protein RHGRI_003570 [Rhododendron griersonianum]|uniref:Uncharacterized protein n=1 Tax=Rhododendron griersonianum TaxID=479676 RepID=A0AAV6L5T2_9ERIC|nr:hypothetical protein RHGRI_003570 [Rhododendron griersonianum]